MTSLKWWLPQLCGAGLILLMHMQNMTLKCMFNKFSSPTGIHRGLQQVFQTSRTYVWGGFVRRLIGTNGMVNVLGEKDNSHLMYMRRPNRHPQFLPWYTTSRIIAPSPRRIDKDAHSKPNPPTSTINENDLGSIPRLEWPSLGGEKNSTQASCFTTAILRIHICHFVCGYYRKHGTDAPHDTFAITFQACFEFFRNLVRLQENGLIAKVSWGNIYSNWLYIIFNTHLLYDAKTQSSPTILAVV